MDLNNGIRNTEYKFVRKAMMLTRYIADKLDEDQTIKRLLYYNTKTPLSNKGLGYDGNIISQPDIDFSLIDTSHIENGLFDDKMQSSVKNQVYVHVYQARPMSNVAGSVNILVSVLIDKKYEYLADKFDMRSWLILDRVANLLSDVYIDETNASPDLVEELGNLKFEIDRGGIRSSRLGKGSSVITSAISITVDLITMRTNK